MNYFIKFERNLDYFNENVFYYIRYFVYAIVILGLLIKSDSSNQINNFSLKHKNKSVNLSDYETTTNEFIDFEGFNNVNGTDRFIVPNIIHYVHLDQSNLSFITFLSILSAWINHRPDFIYLHCNKCNYRGKYWIALKNKPFLKDIIIIKQLNNLNMKIFNQKPGYIHHKSDVIRLLVLMNYGGIYLDNDMIIVNSMDKYRKFEIALSWDSDKDGIGNQILIANKNARLLRAMFDGYRYKYDPKQWYYNGGFYPAEILLKNRYLAHAVKYYLGTQMLVPELYKTKNWSKWKQMDSIHLLINHRSYLDKESNIKEFNEINIQNYQFTFGEIARDILNKNEIIF